MQFCYHAHYHEFARVDDTSGYDIMLRRCDPELLKMEMDVFWATYAGQDPLDYFQKHPGRFPLLHIKDFKRGLVDFPSLREGRVVLLCWQMGEGDELAWWHDVDAGFAGRTPL